MTKWLPRQKNLLLLLSVLFFTACGGLDNPDNLPNMGQSPIKPVGSVDIMAVKMAESIMSRRKSGYGGWNYETATVLRGFQELYGATGDERLYNYLKKTVDNAVDTNGKISSYRESDYNIDRIKEGSIVLYLYQKTGDERYKTAAEALRKQLANHPRTSDGGFWHKKKYSYQMWLDGLYMAQPFYVANTTKRCFCKKGD